MAYTNQSAKITGKFNASSMQQLESWLIQDGEWSLKLQKLSDNSVAKLNNAEDASQVRIFGTFEAESETLGFKGLKGASVSGLLAALSNAGDSEFFEEDGLTMPFGVPLYVTFQKGNIKSISRTQGTSTAPKVYKTFDEAKAAMTDGQRVDQKSANEFVLVTA